MKRRRRNVKMHAGSVVPRFLVVVIVLVVVSGLSYLWMHTRCSALGKAITRLEEVKKQLAEQRQNEESKWYEMTTPRNVMTALRKHNIEMNWPDEKRVVRIVENEAHHQELERPRALYAQRSLVTVND